MEMEMDLGGTVVYLPVVVVPVGSASCAVWLM